MTDHHPARPSERLAGTTRRPLHAASDAPARHLQLHDDVVDRIGRRIVSGTYPSGTRLLADALAAELTVSRSVIREALRVLTAMGLIDVRRRAGITVLPQDRWSALDPLVVSWQLSAPDQQPHLGWLGDVCASIEPLAAHLAAQNASPRQCGELTAAVVAMSASARAALGSDFVEAHARFHLTVLAASGNPYLRSFGGLVAQLHAARMRSSTEGCQSVTLHGELASAVQRGATDEAREVMERIVGAAPADRTADISLAALRPVAT